MRGHRAACGACACGHAPTPTTDEKADAGSFDGPGDQRGEEIVVEQRDSARVLKDEPDFVRGKSQVDGDDDGTDPGPREEDLKELQAVRHHQRHPVALADAQIQHSVGQGVHPAVELAIRHPPTGLDDGRLARVPQGRPGQQVSDGGRLHDHPTRNAHGHGPHPPVRPRRP